MQPMMQLLYSDTFDIERFVGNRWNGQDYYVVRTMPCCEMLSHSPAEAANELMLITNSTEWKTMQRRSIRTGDAFRYGDQTWMLVDNKTLQRLKGGHTTYPVSNRAAVSILQLDGNKIGAM